MKPVESVSIGGYVFSLENDACSRVKEYLDELDTFYSRKESGNEIMEGIEERMSELLFEKSGSGGVVTRTMVENVISTLGRPEAIESESEDISDDKPEADPDPVNRSAAPNHASAPKGSDSVKKRLYRDPAHGMIAGVCSGLGTFLNVDPVIFRLIFIVLALAGFGLGNFTYGDHSLFSISMPVLYIIMWVCMPAAKTVSQRNELRGEKGTVDEISEKIRSGAAEIGETSSRVVKSESFSSFGRFCIACIGTILLVAGIALLVCLGAMVWGKDIIGHGFFYNMLLERISAGSSALYQFLNLPSALILLALAVLLPAAGMIYSGILMIFNLKAPKWRPGLCMFIVWLIVVVIIAVVSAMIVTQGYL